MKDDDVDDIGFIEGWKHSPWHELAYWLDQSLWTKAQAVFLVSGLKPEEKWELASGLVWLPSSRPKTWAAFTEAQLAGRVGRRLITAAHRFSCEASEMSPYAWLAVSLRDRDAAAEATPGSWPSSKRGEIDGIAPPWLRDARQKEHWQFRFPPLAPCEQLDVNIKYTAIHEMWEAWVLGEAEYADKEAFIAECLNEFPVGKNFHEIPPTKTVRDWIGRWERSSYTPYGKDSVTNKRGYGPPLIGGRTLKPVKKSPRAAESLPPCRNADGARGY